MKTVEQVISEMNTRPVEKPTQPVFPMEQFTRALLLQADLIRKSLMQVSDEIRQSTDSVKEAIREIPQPEIPETDVRSIVESIEQLKDALPITDPPEPIDFSPVIEAINALELTSHNEAIDLDPLRIMLARVEDAIKKLELPSPTIVNDLDISPIAQALKSLEAKIQPALPINLEPVKEATENVEVAIRSLRFPIPTPVTQFDVNPLRGVVKTTAVTVSTSATALPGTALTNRRSIIVYNNGATTLYLGGSDVTTSNGIPVTAGTFSSPFDFGNSMTLYGIVASSTLNTRVMEASNDAVGSS